MRAYRILCACLISAMLAGCVVGQQRGMSGSSYISTSRPTISVSVPDIPFKTAGFGCGMLRDSGIAGSLMPDVRVAVYGTDAKHPMAVVAHAELPDNWIWTTVYPRPGAINQGFEVMGDMGFASYTYLVPARTDPFGGIFGDPVDVTHPCDVLAARSQSGRYYPCEGLAARGQSGSHWIARYFASITNFRQSKIIFEYREPVPADMVSLQSTVYGTSDWIQQFEARAARAFRVAIPEPGTMADDRPSSSLIRWQYLRDPFLGDVMQQDLGPDLAG